ncbi:hypothetical protein ElyMa_001279200 [Elysia marginata]|uniref:Uncharacterized protein n=1 Tax=Elysia marginata TaxID=1093978 RepID=A0AAV4IDZ2_9GAST|nr:hypothetical protein ElyMa_001279200 [Elysia marginata]
MARGIASNGEVPYSVSNLDSALTLLMAVYMYGEEAVKDTKYIALGNTTGGWTVKTIDLKTPMILNIPYDGTGMLFQDIFTDSSIVDRTSMCCCTGSPRGAHKLLAGACLDL